VKFVIYVASIRKNVDGFDEVVKTVTLAFTHQKISVLKKQLLP
jgi:hypothetical protein